MESTTYLPVDQNPRADVGSWMLTSNSWTVQEGPVEILLLAMKTKTQKVKFLSAAKKKLSEAETEVISNHSGLEKSETFEKIQKILFIESPQRAIKDAPESSRQNEYDYKTDSNSTSRKRLNISI